MLWKSSAFVSLLFCHLSTEIYNIPNKDDVIQTSVTWVYYNPPISWVISPFQWCPTSYPLDPLVGRSVDEVLFSCSFGVNGRFSRDNVSNHYATLGNMAGFELELSFIHQLNIRGGFKRYFRTIKSNSKGVRWYLGITYIIRNQWWVQCDWNQLWCGLDLTWTILGLWGSVKSSQPWLWPCLEWWNLAIATLHKKTRLLNCF